ncbi:MAG: 16S rRNA (cytidine(1402)-2'-O)-methyltransferase [Magnetococcales bacterium]|nr:16S rRNA (cytidine(1402)-2'-O)-methyltransferase [Magnetococcales bacterium]
MIQGRLYIIPTPIGNLEDITLRAIRLLGEVDRILAEDTRRTRVLCHHYAIRTAIVSVRAHNLPGKLASLVSDLSSGARYALVSDAGMPGVSDPGVPLVHAAAEQGIPIEVLPGASAVVTALAGSGLSADRFVFSGFPPRKGGRRRQWLQQLLIEPRTTVFYEAPLRLTQTLADLAAQLEPSRHVVVARELTKLHESWYRGTPSELASRFSAETVRGEITVVVAGCAKPGVQPHRNRYQPDATADEPDEEGDE